MTLRDPASVNDGRPMRLQLGVQEADVERRVVDDDLGAARGTRASSSATAREQRLVGEELVGQAVHLERVVAVGALRVHVEVHVAAGEPPVDHLDAADLDDAVARLGRQAGGFGVEEDLSHRRLRSCRGRRGSRAPTSHSATPASTIGTHSHWPMLRSSASRPRKLSGSRKNSAMKRKHAVADEERARHLAHRPRAAARTATAARTAAALRARTGTAATDGAACCDARLRKHHRPRQARVGRRGPTARR